MTDFAAELSAYTARHGVPDRIELLLCDLNAVLRGKWLPGDQAHKLSRAEVRLPLSTYAPNILGQEVESSGLGIIAGDPDGRVVPVSGSLKRVPWTSGHVAQVLIEMLDGDAISPLSGREILRAVVQRFADKSLHPVVATELEFYIVKKRALSSDPSAPPDRVPLAQNYDQEVLARFRDILADILEAARVQGLATDTLIAEYGPGQFEINFHHTDDIPAPADTALLFRRLVRGVVDKHGLEATFMAKPYARLPGNGMHAHVSVLDGDGGNIFAARRDVAPALKSAVAGVLASMAELQAIFAPHMNSYRRFQPASFAPCRPDWGFDNRAAAVRLPTTTGVAARLEHRISGA
ncbi:MAG: glutamine synthetase family protein, partial [Paracoccaceae bacterium]